MIKARIFQISDLHLKCDQNSVYHGSNPWSRLKLILKSIPFEPHDVLLITGDIAEDPYFDVYQACKTLLQQYCNQIYAIAGNHDDVEVMQQVFDYVPSEAPVYLKFNYFCLLLCNSKVNKKVHGDLSVSSYQMLESLQHLNESSLPHVIAMHHPAWDCSSEWMNDIQLKQKDEFIKIAKQFKMPTNIVSGHVHQYVDVSITNSVRLLSTPSTAIGFTADRNNSKDDRVGYVAHYVMSSLSKLSLQSSVVYIDVQ